MSDQVALALFELANKFFHNCQNCHYVLKFQKPRDVPACCFDADQEPHAITVKMLR